MACLWTCHGLGSQYNRCDLIVSKKKLGSGPYNVGGSRYIHVELTWKCLTRRWRRRRRRATYLQFERILTLQCIGGKNLISLRTYLIKWLGSFVYKIEEGPTEFYKPESSSWSNVFFRLLSPLPTDIWCSFFFSRGLTGVDVSRWSGNESTCGAKLASNCFIGALADAREHRDRTSHNSIRPAPSNRHLGSKFSLQEAFLPTGVGHYSYSLSLCHFIWFRIEFISFWMLYF